MLQEYQRNIGGHAIDASETLYQLNIASFLKHQIRLKKPECGRMFACIQIN